MNMTFDITGRQLGKTSKLVQWVLAGERTAYYPYWSRIMLVHSRAEAARLLRWFRALDKNQVLSYEEWNKQKEGIPIDRQPLIGLDNVDIYLRWHVGQVVQVTGTGDRRG